MGENRPVELPVFFVERMKMQLGDEWGGFASAIDQEATVSLRLHPVRWKGPFPAERIPWCATGFYLSRRPLFTLDPWFHGGAYYVQEAASMFLEAAFLSLRLASPALVLDLCAAPGGKSTHLLSLLSPEDLLVSNEVIRGRRTILQETTGKWGYPNVVVTSNDPAGFGRLKPVFDLVVADVPCSGEGLFRKEPSSRQEWSVHQAAHCAARQKRIVSEAWKCLKPGGYLIYSTCTYNPAENEENAAWLSSQPDACPVAIAIPPAWNIQTAGTGAVSGYQFYPHRTRSEGFFLALIGKTGTPATSRYGKHFPRQWIPADNRVRKSLRNWVIPDFQGEILANNNEFTLFPSSWMNLLALLETELYICRPGTAIATGSEANLLPHQDLAHSLILNRDVFPVYETDLPDALRFLQKQPLPPVSSEKGWQLVSYRDLPLGWIRNLGNRTNNYFPGERRIRMKVGEPPVPWHQSDL